MEIGHTWNSWEEIFPINHSAFNTPAIHHIGIVAPKDISVNTLYKNCEKLIDFPEQKLFMGYTHVKAYNALIEIIKPYSDKSPLKRYITSSVWTLDHYCYHAKFVKKLEINIGNRFYSPLWEKNCQFFLDCNSEKIEIIYED